MPTILKTEDLSIEKEKKGWVVTKLANAETFGAAAMVAQRWSFEPGARSAEFIHDKTERFLYVISGDGTAFADGKEYFMDDEAVLWLEAGDCYFVEAGSKGLEILVGYAPGQ